MTADRRLSSGGFIDRSHRLSFTFDDRILSGLRGDTLASALLASGVRVVSKSPVHGRPRGIFSAGPEEPCAFVEISTPDLREPIVAAPVVELCEGLAATGLVAKGKLALETAPRRYEKRFAHCDVLIVGAGPAGLAASLEISRTGQRVIVVERDFVLGGSLLSESVEVDGTSAREWLADAFRTLQGAPDTLVLTRATALGIYDQNEVVVAETGGPGSGVSGRLWHIRTSRIVLATGAVERPVIFANNDRPGIMLASAARTYLARYAAKPGTRAVLCTPEWSSRQLLPLLADAGIDVVETVDPDSGLTIADALGPRELEGVTIGRRDGSGEQKRVACDLLLVSGGWTPSLHLYRQAGGRVRLERGSGMVRLDDGPPEIELAGGCAGASSTQDAMAQGVDAGRRVVTGERPTRRVANGRPPVGEAEVRQPAFDVLPAQTHQRQWAFVDLGRDTTIADIEDAIHGGLRSPEHVKRFTSLGTGSDQGRTAWDLAMLAMADLLGEDPAGYDLPRDRPPASPVPLALIAGRDRGDLHDPTRRTPIHAWHIENRAVFEQASQWLRPSAYLRDGESFDAAVRRECATVRSAVGLFDASTLGKVDVSGPDAAEFLDHIYVNDISTLRIGRCRYSVMCGMDGVVFDDGVVARISDHQFHVTTTTGNAVSVYDWLEEWLQTEWPELRVWCTITTEQWATIALVGPKSRDVLARVSPDLDLSADQFRFMTWQEAVVAGVRSRVFRISFSGELAYEINVPGRSARSVWEALAAAGRDVGLCPYGTEALRVLRAEKGYIIIDQDSDGTTSPVDLGLAPMLSTKKWFIGQRSLRRSAMLAPDRMQLVSILPEEPTDLVPEGAQILLEGSGVARSSGHVTSSYFSDALGRAFALGLVRGGRLLHGDRVRVVAGSRESRAILGSPVLLDPEGTRRDG